MNRVFNILSEKGDQYRLSLSDDDGLSLSREMSSKYNVSLISIELVRVSGESYTSIATLAAIEQLIADAFQENPNSILLFFCDFLNPVPSSKKSIPPQEYRSRLFSLMFRRYVSMHNLDGVNEVVIRIDGEEEPYFIHMIARKEHLPTVYSIAEDVQSQYEK